VLLLFLVGRREAADVFAGFEQHAAGDGVVEGGLAASGESDDAEFHEGIHFTTKTRRTASDFGGF